MAFVIGVVYRPPNSNVVQFNETLNDILAQVSHTPSYVMGDYNIDLLKHELHQPTERFLEAMYSNSLLPMILKPTRETLTTATLIYNIFTNKYHINDNILQGIFVTDISDHYMIFHISEKCSPDIEAPEALCIYIYVYIYMCIFLIRVLLQVVHTTGVSFSIGEAAPHHIL